MPTIIRVARVKPSKPKKRVGNKETRGVHDSRLWRDKIRPQFLREHPLCIKCELDGVVREATEVDHIVPIAFGGLKYDTKNLQALCKSCHSKKTASENKAGGR